MTQEQIDQAKSVSILDYLQANEPQELKRIGRYYTLRTHDSMRIDTVTGKWFWNSQNIQGSSAIDYLMSVYQMTFIESVKHLTMDSTIIYHSSFSKPTEPKPFQLPTAHSNNDRVISYLTSRCIDHEIIEYCINHMNIFMIFILQFIEIRCTIASSVLIFARHVILYSICFQHMLFYKKIGENMRLKLEHDDKYVVPEVQIKYRELDDKIERVIQAIHYNNKTFLAKNLQNNNEYVIELNDIYYIEVVNRKTFIYLDTAVYQIEEKFYMLSRELETFDFCQIDKNTVVNFRKIEKVTPLPNSRLKAHLSNDEIIVVSRKYINVLRNALRGEGL